MKAVIQDNEFLYTFKAVMSEKDFSRLSGFIYNECGIKLPPVKKLMLESRLRKRLRALGLASYKDYCEYLFSPAGMEHELVHMIDAVTTNKTDFFREPNHFKYLAEQVLPEFAHRNDTGAVRRLNIWSAGCSTGEEPYTLAIVLSEFAEKYAGGRLDFLIHATDISTKVLGKAKNAVYSHDVIGQIPLELRRKYLLRSRNKDRALVKIVPELRQKVVFGRLNFLDSDFGLREKMDIIFCRNVLIYFDRMTQEKILNRFCRLLKPGGYVFLGHSENIHGMDVPLIPVATTIYRKPV